MVRRLKLALPLLIVAALALAPAAGAQNFVANLSAGQTVPRSMSGASGSCTAVLLELEDPFDPSETIRQLGVSCVHNVEGVVAAHIHRGAAGETGPIAFPFDDPENPAGVFEVSDEDYAYLLTESLYVNVHSAAFPPGEIRGQVRFQSGLIADAAIFLPLSGDQVVPPVATEASGRCLVAMDELDGPLAEITLACYHNVENPMMAHIHQGAAGENGGVLINLGDPTSPIIVEDEQVTSDLVQEFLAGGLPLYVQIHSMDHPPGELRGQIAGCIEGPKTLCLQDGRFQVEAEWGADTDVPPDGDVDIRGQATAVRQTLDSGTLWFFDPDNHEVLIKVLDGCNLADFNSFWVFYAATTDVEFTITVTDTKEGVVKTYGNELGTAAPPITDTAAFATCP